MQTGCKLLKRLQGGRESPKLREGCGDEFFKFMRTGCTN